MHASHARMRHVRGHVHRLVRLHVLPGVPVRVVVLPGFVILRIASMDPQTIGHVESAPGAGAVSEAAAASETERTMCGRPHLQALEGGVQVAEILLSIGVVAVLVWTQCHGPPPVLSLVFDEILVHIL